MTIETLVILALATWYAAYAVTSTHGPGGVFEWIREHVWHGRRGFRVTTEYLSPSSDDASRIGTPVTVAHADKAHNGVLDCPICLAFWVALILVIVTIGHVDIVLTLAVAGLAMLAHGFSGWRYSND